MADALRDRTIALAGLFQCVHLVQQLAWHGRADEDELKVCLGSLFKFDVSGYADVYERIDCLNTGMNVLIEQLGSSGQRRDLELSRYGVTLLFLERRLNKRDDLREHLMNNLQAATNQLEFFELNHENVVSRLADIYQNSISLLGPRVIVHGEQTLLSDTDIANRIRSLLLAGIRASVLWRQAGGNRWRLFLNRSAIVRQAEQLLAA